MQKGNVIRPPAPCAAWAITSGAEIGRRQDLAQRRALRAQQAQQGLGRWRSHEDGSLGIGKDPGAAPHVILDLGEARGRIQPA